MKRKKIYKMPRCNVKRRFAVLLVLLSVTVIVIIAVDIRLKPIVRAEAESKVHHMCVETVNKATAQAVSESNFTYDTLVKVERGENGEINAVMADVVRLNELKVSINEKILASLEKIDDDKIRIPIGTLTGSSLLSGVGPDIAVELTLTGSSEAEVKSKFENVGINQTRHSIFVSIKCLVLIIMLDSQSEREIELTLPIAETVIVGDVPSTYLNVG